MNVELIPVIEITNYGQDLSTPEKGPYWEHADAWEEYKQLSNQQAGFPDKLNSFFKGSSFYTLDGITDSNLHKLIVDEITEARNSGDDLELVCVFSGGYVLRIDGQNRLYPQCCSNLSNIQSWKDLVNGKEKTFYQGHPAPLITISDKIIRFNLAVGEKYYEQFVPPPEQMLIEVEITLLKHAVEQARIALQVFANRVLKINADANLHIPDLEKRLIFGYNE